MKLTLGMRNLAESNSQKKREVILKRTEKLISLVISKYIWRGPISQGMCHVGVMGIWLTPISSRARRSKPAVRNGVSVQGGGIEMEGSSGFTAKRWDCPTSGAYLGHKLVGKEKAVVVISCSCC